MNEVSLQIMDIWHDSVVDGEGLRTVVFFAGCSHRCRGCHNPKSWKRENGTSMTVAEVLKEVLSNSLTQVTFSGGEPFEQAKGAAILAEHIKRAGKNLWAYTGYTLEQLIEGADSAQLKLLRQCDVLVDGPFILEERDLSLSFRGSRNQRLWKAATISSIINTKSKEQGSTM